jgi:hypothetical protein
MTIGNDDSDGQLLTVQWSDNFRHKGQPFENPKRGWFHTAISLLPLRVINSWMASLGDFPWCKMA